MFEHTSKISLDDILEAEKQRNEEERKVISPYTKVKKKRINKEKIKTVFEILLLIVVILLFIIFIFRPKDEKVIDEIMIRSDLIEFTK